ncbi:MAG: thiamine phosphate synthase, partial [Pseudomonadota bacterium]
INESNIPQLSATGVHGLALVSAICHAEDSKAASEYLLGLMS